MANSASDVLRELQSLGTQQNRKVYARYGVGPSMYGVSYAHLGKLTQRIQTDQALAEALWESGIHDARVLATMIADPARMTDRLLESWALDLDSHVLADAFATLVGKTPLAQKKMEKWIDAKGEWMAAAGWGLVGRLAMSDGAVADEFLQKILTRVERAIHSERNRVRHAMNTALICIGLRSPAFQKRAIEAAGRIGKVEVDHGETGCTTPDAASYIKKVAARRAKKGKGKVKAKARMHC
ncbi:MAG: DNA alkylation repair protein [Planctomycetia bacterium]|nr:DNA alkylation repair protein [Planctomycetia bacterium]